MTQRLGGRKQPGPGEGLHVALGGGAPALRRLVRDALERVGDVAAGQEQANTSMNWEGREAGEA